tara:strand:- start:235 stop:525 length:291 start_codon:yes stop_codon:yes gene_type:complete
MRALQNAYLMVMMLVIITVFTTTGCQSRTIELLDGLCFNDKDGTYICDPDITEPVPTDYLDGPIEKCTHIERYEFDVPGIDAHEVERKVDCEEVIS